jgi:hypothetical protein
VAVDITDKDFVKFVARNSGPINVYAKDTVTGEDELKSTHTTVRKAQQKAGNLALAAAYENPAVRVRYEKHEVVDVTINAQDITMQVDAPSGVLQPLLTNYTMVAEPASYSLSGAVAGTSKLVVPPAGPGWITTENWTGVPVGTSVTVAGNALGNYLTLNQVRADIVSNATDPGVNPVTGDRCCKIYANSNSDTWGMMYSYPTNLNVGEEIWVRCYFKYPAGFKWEASGAKLKTFGMGTTNGTRSWLNLDHIRRTNPVGNYSGYLNDNAFPFYYANNYRVLSEVSGDYFDGPGFLGRDWYDELVPLGALADGGNPFVGVRPLHDEWTCLEQYIKMATTNNSGGIWRIWQDGILIFEDTYHFTMNPGILHNHCQIHSFWNNNATGNGPLQNQHAYIDAFEARTSQPSQQDAFNNYMIGTV